MKLEDYCRQIGWNASELARQAGIDRKTADKALAGEIVSAKSARAIASALSAALGARVLVSQIDGLQYR